MNIIQQPSPGGQLISLASIQGGVPVTTSLILASGTDNEHASLIKLIRSYRDDLEEFGQVRFEIEPGYNNCEVEFAILNEQQATLILTYMRNSEIVRGFKKALVRAFWELAKQKQDPLAALMAMTRPEMLEMAAGLARDRAALQAQNSTQAATIAVLAPKAEFADRVTRSVDAMSFRDFAKLLGTGQNTLCGWLREVGALIPDTTEPYQAHVNQGYFKVIELAWEDPKTKRDRTCTKTLITGKGQSWLQKKWDARGGR